MSFNEKLSYTEHVVTTPTTDFAIGFMDYGLPSDTILVFVDDVPATEAGYTIIRKNTMVVELQPAVESGVVRLQRETNLDESFYRFTAGAKFVAANIDANFNQILHSQQEIRDGFTKLSDDVYPLVEGLEEALDKADEASKAAQAAAEAAADAAAAAEEAAQVTRSASQVIDASGKTQQEVNDAQALVNKSKLGYSNASLVSRLDAITNNNTSYIVKRTADSAISFGCGQFGEWGSEYGMELDPDGMLLVRGGFCNIMEYYSTRHNATNLVGNFSISPTSTTANYAQTVGDKFDLSFAGTNLTFQHWADYRGGMWDISIDGGSAIRVKTYDVSTTGFLKDTVVATGLSNTTHTAVFTYAGADPDSSAPTNRGWFCQEKAGNTTYNTGYVYFDAYPKVVKQRGVRPQLIAYNSIIEFAVRATPFGTTIPSQWCPAHGTENINVCRNVTREIYVDGVLTTLAALSVVPKNIKSVIVKQTYTAYCPTDTTNTYPLWDGVLTHKYSDGKLSVSHSLDVRTKCTATGYCGMFPTSNAYSNKLLMQDGTSYVVEPVAGSIPFSQPMDTGVFISEAYKSAASFKTNVANTLNLDANLYVDGQVFFEKRTDSVNKVYWQTFNSTLLEVGDRFAYTNEYFLSANNPSLGAL